MDSLVTTEWLADHLEEPDLVVLDCSFYVTQDASGAMQNVNGRAEYDDGHIPGAGFADQMGELADPDSPFEFTLPTPEQFCAAMGSLGVGDDSRVVLYDATMSVAAARVWWMLRWVGFDRAAVLDGGQVTWEIEERPLSTLPSSYPPRRLTPALRPELFASQDEVRAAVGEETVCVIDTLPAEHYRGDWAIYRRPGHIPGALNISVMDMVDEQGRYLPRAELEALHAAGDRDARTITYCGGGIAAAGNAFVMTRLGYTNVAVYDGSLDEWTSDPDNPLVVGPDPG